MQRARVLDAAQAAVASRPERYGQPSEHFDRVARRWNAHLENIGYAVYRDGDVDRLTGSDVAMMLADVKLARLEHDPKHKDSWIDLAGYAACGAEVSHAGDKPEDVYQILAENLNTNLYGDGTPSNIAADTTLSKGIHRECQLCTWYGFYIGERVSVHNGSGTTGRVVGVDGAFLLVRWDTNKNDEKWRWLASDLLHVPEVEEKFGFRVGETVNTKSSDFNSLPGTVSGFDGPYVHVTWPGGHSNLAQPERLRHGP